MATVTKPVALDESLNTTDSTPKNIADVLKDKLGDIASAISGGGGGSGGHTIQNASGANMPQESTMQFKDSHVTDNSQAGKTEVEVIKSVASADYSSETEDGLYLIPDGEGSVIEPASEDYVEVVADGVKTFSQLLDSIFAQADSSKLSETSSLVVSSQILKIEAFTSSALYFTRTRAVSSAVIESIIIRSSGSSDTSITIAQNGTVTVSDDSSYVFTNGTKITLYYGNDKAVVDLQTTANRCLMSNGETVESKLGELIKVVDVPYSDFAWNNSVKAFVSQGAYPAPSGYTAIGFLVYCTNGDAMMSARYSSTSYNVRVLGWIPGGGTPQAIDSTYKFICKVLFQKP